MSVLIRLKDLVALGKKNIFMYQLLLKDERTPLSAKYFLWCAIGYLLLPFDIIPDFIPILSQLDDLIIISLLIFLVYKLIPDDIRLEYKLKPISQL